MVEEKARGCSSCRTYRKSKRRLEPHARLCSQPRLRFSFNCSRRDIVVSFPFSPSFSLLSHCLFAALPPISVYDVCQCVQVVYRALASGIQLVEPP